MCFDGERSQKTSYGGVKLWGKKSARHVWFLDSRLARQEN